MKKQRVKTWVLWVCTILLGITASLVSAADYFLGKFYLEQQKNISLSAEATPMPIIAATPTPEPTRAPLTGDMQVNFPLYNTGVNAEYSYQSDELKIAVNKVEELGVTYYVADIWMKNINCFRTAFSSGKYKGRRESAEKIAQDNNAILAVNGDFLGGLVIRNGVMYSEATLRPTPSPTPFQGDMGFAGITPSPTPRPERATCVLYYNGELATEEYDTFRTRKAMENGAWQGWQFGPTLVRNGKATDDVNAQGRSPRCMLGYYEPGHYCIVTIDGRQKGYSIGMDFEEMTDLALRLGLKEAYNLDGGASAIMTFNGKIINQPSGSGEARNLPDMIVIGEYLDPQYLTMEKAE